jgi:hypothetical protein
MYESELELEDELEGAGEWEWEEEGEFDLEAEWEGGFESEWEFEDEFEGEEFLGKVFKKIGRGVKGFVRKAAPILKAVARKAAPLIGTAIGGPAGGLIAGGLSSTLLREGEWEDELEFEGELEDEFEEESESLGADEAMAEYMADLAARPRAARTAPAMVGAATVASLSSADRAALRRILPHLVHGASILARLLRQQRATRPAIRTVPTIVRRTVSTLKRRAAAGRPISRPVAGRVMALQTQRVLGNPRKCAAAISRNLRAKSAIVKRRPPVRG